MLIILRFRSLVSLKPAMYYVGSFVIGSVDQRKVCLGAVITHYNKICNDAYFLFTLSREYILPGTSLVKQRIFVYFNCLFTFLLFSADLETTFRLMIY